MRNIQGIYQEQPIVLEQIIERFDSSISRIRTAVPKQLASVVFVVRGSSDHAATFGRYRLSQLQVVL